MTRSEPRVRVVVGDDHPVYREGVVRALDNSARTESSRVATAPRSSTGAYTSRCSTITCRASTESRSRTRWFEIGWATKVLLLSATTEGSVVYRAIQDGAAGYLSKESDRDEIVARCRRVCARRKRITSGVGDDARSAGPSARPDGRRRFSVNANGRSCDRSPTASRCRRWPVSSFWRRRRSRRTSGGYTRCSVSTIAARPSRRRCVTTSSSDPKHCGSPISSAEQEGL